eukprot:3619972-Rhodomonas_salina.1
MAAVPQFMAAVPQFMAGCCGSIHACIPAMCVLLYLISGCKAVVPPYTAAILTSKAATMAAELTKMAAGGEKRLALALTLPTLLSRLLQILLHPQQARSAAATPRNPTQETAFLVQIVLKLRFLVLDFGVYVLSYALDMPSPLTSYAFAVLPSEPLAYAFDRPLQSVVLSFTAKSNTRKHNLSIICTRNAFSCIRCRGVRAGCTIAATVLCA